MMPELNTRKDASLALRCLFPEDEVNLRESDGQKLLYINDEPEPRVMGDTWSTVHGIALDALIASRVAEHLRKLQTETTQ